MTQTEIEEYITQFPIYQYAFVKPEDIEFNDRVRQICKKECSRYGASWSCPPAVGTVEVCKERCMNYDHVLFFSSIAEVDNIMDMDETLKTKAKNYVTFLLLFCEISAIMEMQKIIRRGAACLQSETM